MTDGKDTPPQPFRFADPRQQRIYDELRQLVGPGPAACFRDICWLMEQPTVLQTTTHIVGHLLREIESALRALFRPLAEPRPATVPCQGESHRAQIETILQALGIEHNAPPAQAWFMLAKRLHAIAHRQGLDTPRPVEEVRELWDRSQTWLVALLKALREHFLKWVEQLDKLLQKQEPTRADVKFLAQNIPHNLITRGYFFDRLESLRWFKPLRKEGFFRHPPEPERDDEGTIHFPHWPEARYLARMAEHEAELVAEIISEVADTQNAWVHQVLVKALLKMPPDVAARAAEAAKKWAACPYLLFLESFGSLIGHFANGGHIQEALTLAQVLFAIGPAAAQGASAGDSTPPTQPAGPQARFEPWHYERLLRQHCLPLVKAVGLQALDLLCHWLEEAVRTSRRRFGDAQPPEDHSAIWRPAIEEHAQNIRHSIEDVLVSAVRDAAGALVESGQSSIADVIRLLEQRTWNVFGRIALHVLRCFHAQAPELVEQWLTDRTLFDDAGLLHEYTLLLRECFPKLPPEKQRQILGWIEEGPAASETASLGSPSEQERYVATWQRDWLARIGYENLPPKWQRRYETLIAECGEAVHPDLPAHFDVGWRGPASPKSAEELRAMSVEELVAYLASWKPPATPFGEPSPEGLARTLAELVSESPERFASEATRFKGLDPTYVRALITGLRQSLGKQKTFDWQPVLDLCEWVVAQPREIPGRQGQELERDPDWGWTRKAIAELLAAGFEEGPGSISPDLQEQVWAVLEPLSEDPEPTPEYEARYGGSNMDPATLSINTVRGEALHAVIRYALWRHRSAQRTASQEPAPQGFDAMPEVRAVLERHLDTSREPSLAIRAVYGQWFPALVYLDAAWAERKKNAIFPVDDDDGAFFEAAWNTYLAFCRLYGKVLELLKDQYRTAVERIGAPPSETRWPIDPEERLAEHLMVFYCQGTLALDDELMIAFWNKASDALRAHAIAFLGRSLTERKSRIPEQVLARLRTLWQARTHAAQQHPEHHKKEMAAFGWWFASGRFDPDWAFTQLRTVLQLGREAEPDYMVIKTLDALARGYPVETVRCLKMMIEGDIQGLTIYSEQDSIRAILRAALDNPGAHADAVRSINQLASLGFIEFKDLLNLWKR